MILNSQKGVFILHFRHIYVLIIVAQIYVIVNFTYVMISGKRIYPGINWVSMKSHLVISTAFIMMMLTFALGYFVYEKFKRQRIEECLLDKDNSSTNTESVHKY